MESRNERAKPNTHQSSSEHPIPPSLSQNSEAEEAMPRNQLGGRRTVVSEAGRRRRGKIHSISDRY